MIKLLNIIKQCFHLTNILCYMYVIIKLCGFSLVISHTEYLFPAGDWCNTDEMADCRLICVGNNRITRGFIMGGNPFPGCSLGNN